MRAGEHLASQWDLRGVSVVDALSRLGNRHCATARPALDELAGVLGAQGRRLAARRAGELDYVPHRLTLPHRGLPTEKKKERRTKAAPDTPAKGLSRTALGRRSLAGARSK